jgi:hypothetical protein
MFDAVLPVFAIIILGYILRRRGLWQPQADASLISLTIYITYPALILSKMVQDATLRDWRNAVIPALLAAGFMLLGMVVAWVFAGIIGLRDRRIRAPFALACSIQNYGYLPLPILHQLYPSDSWAGVLFVYSLGVECVLWTLGVRLLAGKAGHRLKNLINPVVLSVLAGVGIVLLGLERWMPNWSLNFLTMLGNASFPLGIMMFGVSLADVTQEPGWYRDWKTPSAAIFLRLLALPAAMLALGHVFSPGVEFSRVLAVQAAMPAAVFPLILTRQYGCDEPTCVRVIVGTTLASLVSIPLLLPHFLRWMGQ